MRNKYECFSSYECKTHAECLNLDPVCQSW